MILLLFTDGNSRPPHSFKCRYTPALHYIPTKMSYDICYDDHRNRLQYNDNDDDDDDDDGDCDGNYADDK